jgi:parallel beta-helix repeat protein
MSSQGIEIAGSSNNIISNCHLKSNNATHGGGIVVGGNSDNNTILGNNIQEYYLGILIGAGGCNNNTISGNNIQENTTSGIILLSDNNNVSSNNIQFNDSYGIEINSDNNIVTGNIVGSNTFYGILLSSSSSNNTILGNNVQANVMYGIEVHFSSNNIISGNIISDNGTNGICLVGLSTSPSDNNLISFNHISDTSGSGFGIYFAVGPPLSYNNNYIVGNLIDGAGFSAPIYDSDTNTRYTDKVKITLEPCAFYSISGGKLDSYPGEPTSYIRLQPAGNVDLNGTPNIFAGMAAGDILILENTSSFRVTVFNRTTTKLQGGNNLDLFQNDTLTLIWNGVAWIETGYANN